MNARALLVVSMVLVGCEGSILSPGPMDPGTPGVPGTPGAPGAGGGSGGVIPFWPVGGGSGSSGGSDGAGGGSSTPAGPPFACDSNAAIPATQPHRLTSRQLQRSLTDVLGRFIGATPARTLVNASWTTAALPADGERYKRWSNDFSSPHAQSLFTLADLLAKGVVQNAQAFTTAALALDPTGCATYSATNTACQARLIRNVGLRLVRRPLVDAEVEAYRAEFTGADANTALGNIVFRMLLAPGALFQLEVNEAPVTGRPDRLALSSYAVANRLAFSFWNLPPDEALLKLAATTDLQSESGFGAALAHVLGQSDRLVSATDELMDDWLHLDKTPQFQSSNPTVFALYAGGVKYDAALRGEMVAEVRELAAYVTRENGTLNDLFTSEVSFARGAELMKLYGVSTAAQATVTAGNAVKLPTGQRPGLLSRAAMLVTPAGNKNPVLRGVRVLSDVLCMTPPPPPANLPSDAFAVPPYDENLTARERYRVKTSVNPCNGCHQRINPPGFALSHYNGLGRYEETEPAFKADGSPAGKTLPVDSTVDLSSILGAGATSTTPLEMARLVGAHRETSSCFTQQYTRFFLGREIAPADGCAMNETFRLLSAGQPLKEAMQVLAKQPAFRLKQL